MIDFIETVIWYINRYGGIVLFSYVCVAIFIQFLVAQL